MITIFVKILIVFLPLSQVSDAVNQFKVDDKSLRKLMDLLVIEMEKGLSQEESSKATVKMLPSYVRSLPNGSEKGHFLALDLGGTNFRVLLIKLQGDHKSDMRSKIYQIPQGIMHGSGTQVDTFVKFTRYR